jgi:hypothetical protein
MLLNWKPKPPQRAIWAPGGLSKSPGDQQFLTVCGSIALHRSLGARSGFP